MIGRKAVKIAIATTVITLIVIAAVVLSVVLTREETIVCEKQVPLTLTVSQSNTALTVTWPPGSCSETYTIKLYANGEIEDSQRTTGNEYFYKNLPVCAEITIEVTVDSSDLKKTDFFVPEIAAVRNLAFSNGIVRWNGEHLLSCGYVIQFNDDSEEEVFPGLTFYTPHRDFIACDTHAIRVTPIGSLGRRGESSEIVYKPDIPKVTDVTITDNILTWNHKYLQHCKFEVLIDDIEFSCTETGDNQLTLNEELSACVQHTINIIAIDPKNPDDHRSEEQSKAFEMIPIIEDFQIIPVDSSSFKATWKNHNDKNRKCIYKIYYLNEPICETQSKDECEMTFEENDFQICYDYTFELKATGGNSEWDLDEEVYTPNVSGHIDDFKVEFDESTDTIASWSQLGSTCNYFLIIGTEVEEEVITDNSIDGVFQYTISNEKIDLCTTTEIKLIAKNSKNEIVIEEVNFYSPKPFLKDFDLSMNPDHSMQASWVSLGSTCTYQIEYNNDKKETDKISVNIDKIFGELDYCAEHRFTIQVKTGNEYGKAVEKTIQKDLITNFIGIETMIALLLPDFETVQISWTRKSTISKCGSIEYRISCALDASEIDLEKDPEIVESQDDEPQYKLANCRVKVHETSRLDLYIQPTKKSSGQDETILGKRRKCGFNIVETSVEPDGACQDIESSY